MKGRLITSATIPPTALPIVWEMFATASAHASAPAAHRLGGETEFPRNNVAIIPPDSWAEMTARLESP